MIVKTYLPGRPVLSGSTWQETPTHILADRQLQEYLSLKRTTFDLPMSLIGTPFLMEVWKYLLTIPYGHTVTYKQIAQILKRPNAYRAVGMANARNPLAPFVPCHRVLGSDRSLTGFGGGLAMKQGLLDLEKRSKNS